jgi:hypothetical protein
MTPNPDTTSSTRFELAGKGYDPDQLLTVEDLARRLQISPAWVRDHQLESNRDSRLSG